MPNRIRVNTMSAPGNRQRESTKPFRQPSTAEMIVEGTTIETVRPMAGASCSQALAQFSIVQVVGSSQARAGDASPTPLKLVTNST